MPFENKLVVAQLSGNMVKELFEYLEMRKEAHPISGLQLTLKNDKLETIKIQNKSFDPNKSYWVLTHDYLQHGGDNMAFFKEPLNLFVSDYKVRDALIDNLRKIDTLHSTLDHRFTKIN